VPWTYTFHRFEDKASYEAARDECEKVTSPMYDVIGFLSEETGNTVDDGFGNMIPETVPLPGFLVNLAWPAEMAPAFAASEIHPETPYRTFVQGDS
jgi:hypothetical protein